MFHLTQHVKPTFSLAPLARSKLFLINNLFQHNEKTVVPTREQNACVAKVIKERYSLEMKEKAVNL